MPAVALGRINPGIGEGGDVLGQPDEGRDQKEAEQERHLPPLTVRGEIEPAAPEQHRGQGEQAQPDVRQPVMGEEVDIDRRRQNPGRPQRRIVAEFDVEDALDPGDVAAHRRIHEAREQRHHADPQEAVLRIDPRPVLRLEQLHDRADDVEDEDDPRLLPALQLEREHRRLDGQRPDHQEVIPRDRRLLRPPQMRRQQQGQHRPAEQTGPALFDPEHQEFEAVAGPCPPVGDGLQPQQPLTTQGFEGKARGFGHRGRLTGPVLKGIRDFRPGPGPGWTVFTASEATGGPQPW